MSHDFHLFVLVSSAIVIGDEATFLFLYLRKGGVVVMFVHRPVSRFTCGMLQFVAINLVPHA